MAQVWIFSTASLPTVRPTSLRFCEQAICSASHLPATIGMRGVSHEMSLPDSLIIEALLYTAIHRSLCRCDLGSDPIDRALCARHPVCDLMRPCASLQDRRLAAATSPHVSARVLLCSIVWGHHATCAPISGSSRASPQRMLHRLFHSRSYSDNYQPARHLHLPPRRPRLASSGRTSSRRMIPTLPAYYRGEQRFTFLKLYSPLRSLHRIHQTLALHSTSSLRQTGLCECIRST